MCSVGRREAYAQVTGTSLNACAQVEQQDSTLVTPYHSPNAARRYGRAAVMTGYYWCSPCTHRQACELDHGRRAAQAADGVGASCAEGRRVEGWVSGWGEVANICTNAERSCVPSRESEVGPLIATFFKCRIAKILTREEPLPDHVFVDEAGGKGPALVSIVHCTSLRWNKKYKTSER